MSNEILAKEILLFHQTKDPAGEKYFQSDGSTYNTAFDGNNDPELFARGTDWNLEVNKETVEITNFDSAGWKQFKPDTKDWSANADGVMIRLGVSTDGQIDFDEIFDEIVGTDTPVEFYFKSSSTLVNGVSSYFVGVGTITSAKVSGSIGDKATYSIEIQGVDKIQKVTFADPV